MNAAPFTEFLRKLADKYNAEMEDGRGEAEEWRSAVLRLFKDIRSWLAESDPDKIIKIEERKHSM